MINITIRNESVEPVSVDVVRSDKNEVRINRMLAEGLARGGLVSSRGTAESHDIDVSADPEFQHEHGCPPWWCGIVEMAGLGTGAKLDIARRSYEYHMGRAVVHRAHARRNAEWAYYKAMAKAHDKAADKARAVLEDAIDAVFVERQRRR